MSVGPEMYATKSRKKRLIDALVWANVEPYWPKLFKLRDYTKQLLVNCLDKSSVHDSYLYRLMTKRVAIVASSVNRQID